MVSPGVRESMWPAGPQFNQCGNLAVEPVNLRAKCKTGIVDFCRTRSGLVPGREYATLRIMRAVIQRVLEASVSVRGNPISAGGPGVLVLLGVAVGDDESDVAWLAPKIAKMRIFPDGEGKMNCSVVETGGDLLVVSQFTLHASTKKGNRPSFIGAAGPELAQPLYDAFCNALELEIGKPVGRGIFAADMQVALVNDGPVTIVIDTRERE